MTKTAEDWRNEIIEFARSFASLAVRDGGAIRLRRSPGDLMHVMGYFFEQNTQRLSVLSPNERLAIVADAIRYIGTHLED
jgi:hypothetical protein